MEGDRIGLICISDQVGEVMSKFLELMAILFPNICDLLQV